MSNSSPRSASPRLFERIFELGERLRMALAAERLETAAALVQERDLLVSRLEAFNHPSEVDASWKQWRRRLANQHEALADALAALDTRTTASRRQIEKLSRAHRTYGTTHVSPSGVLHPNFAA